MLTPLRRLMLVLVLLVLPAAAAQAQYRPDEVLARDFQTRVLDIGAGIADAFPDAWRNAHHAGEPAGSEFVRRWALALQAHGITACVNGKRGTSTLSQDVVAFPVTDGWARDTSGRFAGRLMIVDVIVGAGAPGAALAFGPDASGADGKCIEPFLEAGERAGGSPPPPVVGPPPQPPPAPGVDLAPVLAQLQALTAAVEGKADRAQVEAARAQLDSLYAVLAEQVIAIHMGALYERLERQQQAIEQLQQTLNRIAASPLLRVRF